ncbi:hypothetical protein C4D60_Mb06t33250 [Musa balbisiana]|uniref:Plant bHLH transcription factor ACT-like domain-containing protein n=1 Tax=Musa balbisiana TaxID=52838 RepID=A0A4S8ISG8_MUSBA|nr:hypothetical protein C4D60_Mb06t33250 [Musa balbisiana]
MEMDRSGWGETSRKWTKACGSEIFPVRGIWRHSTTAHLPLSLLPQRGRSMQPHTLSHVLPAHRQLLLDAFAAFHGAPITSRFLALPLRKSSIIVDASKYIKELKQKIQRLNQEIESTHSTVHDNPLPSVTVETLKKGFLINVFSEKSCPGLLVAVLEAIESLGLSVVEAKASCTNAFLLELFGREVR